MPFETVNIKKMILYHHLLNTKVICDNKILRDNHVEPNYLSYEIFNNTILLQDNYYLDENDPISSINNKEHYNIYLVKFPDIHDLSLVTRNRKYSSYVFNPKDESTPAVHKYYVHDNLPNKSPKIGKNVIVVNDKKTYDPIGVLSKHQRDLANDRNNSELLLIYQDFYTSNIWSYPCIIHKKEVTLHDQNKQYILICNMDDVFTRYPDGTILQYKYITLQKGMQNINMDLSDAIDKYNANNIKEIYVVNIGYLSSSGGVFYEFSFKDKKNRVYADYIYHKLDTDSGSDTNKLPPIRIVISNITEPYDTSQYHLMEEYYDLHVIAYQRTSYTTFTNITIYNSTTDEKTTLTQATLLLTNRIYCLIYDTVANIFYFVTIPMYRNLPIKFLKHKLAFEIKYIIDVMNYKGNMLSKDRLKEIYEKFIEDTDNLVIMA